MDIYDNVNDDMIAVAVLLFTQANEDEGRHDRGKWAITGTLMGDDRWGVSHNRMWGVLGGVSMRPGMILDTIKMLVRDGYLKPTGCEQFPTLGISRRGRYALEHACTIGLEPTWCPCPA